MASNIKCELAADVGAFYDGEMDAARREAFARHLEACGSCREELEKIEGLATFLAEGKPQGERLSQMAAYRIENNVRGAMRGDVMVVRLGRVLSAAAACIVVVGSIQLARSAAAPAAETLPPWAEVTTSNNDLHDAASATPAARWYLVDASRGAEETP